QSLGQALFCQLGVDQAALPQAVGSTDLGRDPRYAAGSFLQLWHDIPDLQGCVPASSRSSRIRLTAITSTTSAPPASDAAYWLGYSPRRMSSSSGSSTRCRSVCDSAD